MGQVIISIAKMKCTLQFCVWLVIGGQHVCLAPYLHGSWFPLMTSRSCGVQLVADTGNTLPTLFLDNRMASSLLKVTVVGSAVSTDFMSVAKVRLPSSI